MIKKILEVALIILTVITVILLSSYPLTKNQTSLCVGVVLSWVDIFALRVTDKINMNLFN